jgi:hypothetical protein
MSHNLWGNAVFIELALLYLQEQNALYGMNKPTASNFLALGTASISLFGGTVRRKSTNFWVSSVLQPSASPKLNALS